MAKIYLAKKDVVDDLVVDVGEIDTRVTKDTSDISNMNAIRTVTFTAAGWTGSSAPYTQRVSVVGLRPTMRPIVAISVENQTSASVEGYLEAYSYINSYDTDTDALIATAMIEKPTADVTVILKGE